MVQWEVKKLPQVMAGEEVSAIDHFKRRDDWKLGKEKQLKNIFSINFFIVINGKGSEVSKKSYKTKCKVGLE